MEVHGMRWQLIPDSDAWERVDAVLKGGEDGIIKEVRLLNSDYVDETRRLIYGDGSDLTITFQLQSSSPREFRMLCRNVQYLCIDTGSELELAITFTDNRVALHLSALGAGAHLSNSVVEATEVYIQEGYQ